MFKELHDAADRERARQSYNKALKSDLEYKERNKHRINDRPIPVKMVGSKIISVTDCKGPIPCTSISFEDGWRLDIDRTGDIQCVSPTENPYYDVKTKTHKPIK